MEVIQIRSPDTNPDLWIGTRDPDQIRLGGGLRSPSALVLSGFFQVLSIDSKGAMSQGDIRGEGYIPMPK